MDHAATTPMDSAVFEVMKPYFSEVYGNPSSVHHKGQEARRAIDGARHVVAKRLNCDAREIIFTGSGTESDNLAIKGVCFAYQNKGKHIITNRAEHHAVLKTIEYLEKNHEFEVTYVPVDSEGAVNPADIKNAIREDTIFCSIMYANNEVGTINPIAEIGRICRKAGVLFHTDACQAAGVCNLDVEELRVDLMTLNGSKIYGPKGIGVLYRKKGIDLVPMMLGGEGQEHRLRAGTENTATIVGFSKALELAHENRESENDRVSQMRDYMLTEILQRIPDTTLNGPDPSLNRLPNNINVCFEGIDGESLLMRLDMEGICATSGSACTSGSIDPSHVLSAMGIEDQLARGALRLSLGRGTTEAEVEHVLEVLPKIVKDLREYSPIYNYEDAYKE